MLLAVGDSITAIDPDVRDDPGVPYRPWAVWVGEALGLDVRLIAQPGATAPDLLPTLGTVPLHVDVAVVYLGVNDVRSPDWDPDRFVTAYRTVLSRVAASAARLVVCTVPLDVGRPRAGAKVADVNALIADAAAGVGAQVCRLDDMAGPPLLQPDAVHPTATGQRWIAARVAGTLGAELV